MALEQVTDLKEEGKEDIESNSEDDLGEEDTDAPSHSKQYSSLDSKVTFQVNVFSDEKVDFCCKEIRD